MGLGVAMAPWWVWSLPKGDLYFDLDTPGDQRHWSCCRGRTEGFVYTTKVRYSILSPFRWLVHAVTTGGSLSWDSLVIIMRVWPCMVKIFYQIIEGDFSHLYILVLAIANWLNTRPLFWNSSSSPESKIRWIVLITGANRSIGCDN